MIQIFFVVHQKANLPPIINVLALLNDFAFIFVCNQYEKHEIKQARDSYKRQK